jgi:hypothetical protein
MYLGSASAYVSDQHIAARLQEILYQDPSKMWHCKPHHEILRHRNSQNQPSPPYPTVLERLKRFISRLCGSALLEPTSSFTFPQ